MRFLPVLRAALCASFAALLIPGTPAARQVVPAPGEGLGLLPQGQHNILILLADDLGVDQLACYREGSDFPPTPNIDRLRSRGVLFRNVWVNPVCSPTRCTIQTGRYGFRTGVGKVANETQQAMLPSETTLPEMLDAGPGGGQYLHAAIGKWHLANSSVGGDLAPNIAGWSHFDGVEENLYGAYDYFHWRRITNGVAVDETGYITSAEVDWAIEWLRNAGPPWICYLAFNAPHNPFHAPPAHLHTQDLSGAGPPETDPRPYYKAMVEAMDTEIGRLLDFLEPLLDDTIVIFLGDNGTPSAVVAPPFLSWQAKTTIYEGGINVPMIVSGPLVREPGSECQALVNATDLFATVAEIAGVLGPELVPEPVDSVSILPYLNDPSRPSIREWVYSEFFGPSGPGPYAFYERTIRNDRYKYMFSTSLGEGLFDLWADPFQLNNLLPGPMNMEEQQSFQYLTTTMNQLLGS